MFAVMNNNHVSFAVQYITFFYFIDQPINILLLESKLHCKQKCLPLNVPGKQWPYWLVVLRNP